jgi:NAD(P)-dependent dehydrogenase (short-subunit alcohol dehydrogenase family)
MPEPDGAAVRAIGSPHRGRTAVVSGGAVGLGAEYAKRLAADGARLLIADLQDVSQTLAAIEAAGGEAAGVIADVATEDGVAKVAAAVTEQLGRCDILINNAGATSNIPWSALTFGEWRRVVAVNIDSMFLMCHALTGSMCECGFGRIVNISSNTVGLVLRGFVPYASSKAAVIGFTRSLASELGEAGVTVNAVLPGLTQTDATAQKYAGTSFFEDMAQGQAIKRPGVPSDIAGVVSFLASDDARWVTGQAIVADGGLLRH